MGKKHNKGMKPSVKPGYTPQGPVPMPTTRGPVPMPTGNAGFGLAKGGSVPGKTVKAMKGNAKPMDAGKGGKKFPGNKSTAPMARPQGPGKKSMPAFMMKGGRRGG